MVPVQVAQSALTHHIAFLELVAVSVLMACVVWEPMWQGHTVLCWCDNQAAVRSISARSCRDAKLKHLLHCLFFIEACCQFELVARYVLGIDNDLADDLSRNWLASFLSKVPQACQEPTPIPPQLFQVLLDPSLDWTSPAQLDAVVQFCCGKGLADSTQKTYRVALNRYSQFCTIYGVNPFPVSESILCYFVASLARQGLTPATIRTYLAEVRHAQIMRGFEEPRQHSTLPRLHLLQA